MATLRDRPYACFNFLVDLGDGQTEGPDGGFSEVSGLSQEVEVIEYRNGNARENAPMLLPGLARTGRVTLRRGVKEVLVDANVTLQPGERILVDLAEREAEIGRGCEAVVGEVVEPAVHALVAALLVAREAAHPPADPLLELVRVVGGEHHLELVRQRLRGDAVLGEGSRPRPLRGHGGLDAAVGGQA